MMEQKQIKRALAEVIKTEFFRGKVVMVLGPRQVGKTTLVRSLTAAEGQKVLYLDGEASETREALQPSWEHLRRLVAPFSIVVIDEAQKINNIGSSLKLLVDNLGKEKTIIVTGSSSLNLLDKTSEPLTGRKKVFYLYPLANMELGGAVGVLEQEQIFTSQLIYGSYPEVYLAESYQEKIQLLAELTDSYLYRDLLEFNYIKKSNKIKDLLKLLAYQIGSEVAYQEIGNRLNLSKETVESYVDLLEKSFVIFRLTPYRFNGRRAITSKNKIYFYDLGIRNSLLGDFQSLPLRGDRGALFENFCIVERMKKRAYQQLLADTYFYRSYDGAEVDLIEDRGGKLFGYEFKYSPKSKAREPEKWMGERKSTFKVINSSNYEELIGGSEA